MRTNKVLLGSLALAAAFTACTNDEMVEGYVNETSTERAQVNLTLNAPRVESRMTAGENGWTPNYTTNDVLGAVLVDAGYTEAEDNENTIIWNNVNWALVPGHVGNNKWAYENGGFRTDGTTSVGAWLFYTKYNSKMTTTRNGVEFDFPQIQDGASNFEKLQNNNINFHISPVVAIDGYEGDKLAFEIKMASVYNNLRMPFDFSGIEGVNNVQKIVVTAKDVNGEAVKFPSQYKVMNQNLPIAKTSEVSGAPEEIKVPDLSSQAAEMEEAYKTLIYSKVVWNTFEASEYSPAVKTRDALKYYDYLVVDLDEEHTDIASETGGLAVANDGKFSAMMLMPAGVYQSITFKLYTDNGVYEKTVDYRNAYRENMSANKPNVTGEKLIFLRPDYTTVLSDIENVLREVDNTAETLTNEEYIKIEKTDRIEGDLITKTADLIDFINGIDEADSYDVNILTQGQIGGANEMDDDPFAAHTVIINKAVMDAIVAKEEALRGDIQLVFKGSVNIKGGDKAAEALDIHDLTFDESANLIEGFAKVTSDVVVPTNKKMTVKSGSTLDIDMNDTDDEYLYQVNVESAAKLNVNSINNIKRIENVNNGNVVVNSTGNLTVDELANHGTVNNRNVLTLKKYWTSYSDASLTNTGTVNVELEASNAGKITTNGLINVHGKFTNSGEITNGTAGDIVVNSTGTGAFNNAKDATIVNKGEIYTTTAGSNTIQNLGTIDARAGSRTWITTNSSDDEKINGTATVTMGIIKLAKRNTNAVVTTPEFQGYKEYTVAEGDLVEGVLKADTKDLFNKVILSTEAELSADLSYVHFIETSKDLTLPKGARIQELKFTGDAALYTGIPSKETERVVVSGLTINEGVTLDIMDKNELYVYTINKIETSKTDVIIKNDGKLMLGGNLYTELSKEKATQTSPKGVFGSGHGDNTAYQWSHPY